MPIPDEDELYDQLTELPFPPELSPGVMLDGYRIIAEMHASSRSQVYLALDTHSDEKVVVKTPSVNFCDDPAYIERFLFEEWVGRRINNLHVLKVHEQQEKKHFLYYATEYVQGETLAQWIENNPQPDIKIVQQIVEQVARGVRAFHRLEMLHQDLKPDNIVIDKSGVVKIIDFGSTKVSGLAEIASPIERSDILGTVDYTAPEYIVGKAATNRADIYSLGVICYQMLTGKLPYGELPNKPTTRSVAKMRYTPSYQCNPMVPPWLDGALKKAVHLEAEQRYEKLSEFIYDLKNPNKALTSASQTPLLERNPLLFWRTLSLLLLIGNLVLLVALFRT
ncbi:MAG: serine/threonine protein kinase [Gammaproteobacteria bacterium]|nr:serine/threonine protein kinase [Gammaproteobacteria bacterium]